MIFVLEYQNTDGFHYWTDEMITFFSKDEETAYCLICDVVNDVIKSHNNFFKKFKEEDLHNIFIKIQDTDISLNNFVSFSAKEVSFNLIDLETYFENIQKNSKELSFT